jgi:hypothetical protein
LAVDLRRCEGMKRKTWKWFTPLPARCAH